MVDIDRLHYVVENMDHLNRRDGKTTALLFLLLGEVWVGRPGGRFMYVVDHWRVIDNAMHTLRTLLHDYHPDYRIKNQVISSQIKITIPEHNCEILFVSLERFCDTRCIRGRILDRVFFDVDYYTQKKFDTRNDRLSETFAYLMSKGVDVVG